MNDALRGLLESRWVMQKADTFRIADAYPSTRMVRARAQEIIGSMKLKIQKGCPSFMKKGIIQRLIAVE